MKFKFLIRPVAAALAVFAMGAASATPTYPDFTINPNAIIGGSTFLPSITANDISGQYHEVIYFDTANTFTVSLNFFGQGFNYDDTDPSLSKSYTGAQSGLGSAGGYNLLAILNATGHYTTSGGTTSFSIDPSSTGLTVVYDKGAHGGFTAPTTFDGAYTFDGAGDTLYTLATGGAMNGNGSVSCTAPNLCGSFGETTSFNLTNPYGTSFFTSPVPFYPLSLQSGQIEGFPVSVGGSVTSVGTVNVVFAAVPEPADVALVGIALLGLGLAVKRRRSM